MGSKNIARARRAAGAAGAGSSTAERAIQGDDIAEPTARWRQGVRRLGPTFALATGLMWWFYWRSSKWLHPDPTIYSYRIVKQHFHDPHAFTQGLFYLNGSLYESTGLYGQSSLREVKLHGNGSAIVVRQLALEQKHFGEGVVHLGSGDFLMLLWRTGEGLRFRGRAGHEEDGGFLEPSGGFHTPLSDGWGIEYDGVSLLVTDNGPELYYLDPQTFEIQRMVRVNDGGELVQMVNELELVDRELWANVFGNECIARIDPSSGSVLGWIVLDGILDRQVAGDDARKARRQPPDVMNGIAFDPETRRLFITGKLWPTLFEIEVVPAPEITLVEARSRCIPQENIFRHTA